MILSKGIRISVDLGRISAVISQSITGEALLIIVGPERTPGDVYSRYSPLSTTSLPQKDDQSAFANLYWKLDSLVRNSLLNGPYGEDHPRFYSYFQYTRDGSPAGLLALIESAEVTVKVRSISHNGDDDEVERAKKDFGSWVDSSTEFSPNPKIEEARKQNKSQRKLKARMKRAELWDQKFGRFVLAPILLAILVAILWVTLSLHWIISVAAGLLIGFAWWWLRH